MPQFSLHFVPMVDGGEAQEALNAFLRTHRVLAVEHAFAGNGWAFCVEWLDGSASARREPIGGKSPRVDYRETLTPEAFAVFSRLREVRRRLADRDGVQVYAVMTNEQLAEMVRRKVATLSALRDIEGIGESRAGKYGMAFLEALAEAWQTPRERMREVNALDNEEMGVKQ